MKLQKIRKLTPTGMSKLKKDLERLRYSSEPQIKINDYESEEVNVEIDKNKQFDDKFSVGKYFLHIFPENFKPCIKTWNWLSVLYYQQLLHTNKTIGELSRVFISENQSYYPYRHLLKAPYDICQFYKNKPDGLNTIDFLLKDKVHINGVLYRRIAENNDIKKNPEFMKVAKSFFYDKNTKSLKPNITDPIQRLKKVWKQYERSFDMYRMPADEIIKKLLIKHEEFDLFRNQ